MSNDKDDDNTGWAFGDGHFVKIYGDRLAESSLLETQVATRWIFFFMASKADAEGRYRCATVPALARAANVTLAEAEKAVEELMEKDPNSTSPAVEGRRILLIPGGWQIVNYKKYRDFRTPQQARDAERKRREREKKQRKKT